MKWLTKEDWQQRHHDRVFCERPGGDSLGEDVSKDHDEDHNDMGDDDDEAWHMLISPTPMTRRSSSSLFTRTCLYCCRLCLVTPGRTPAPDWPKASDITSAVHQHQHQPLVPLLSVVAPLPRSRHNTSDTYRHPKTKVNIQMSSSASSDFKANIYKSNIIQVIPFQCQSRTKDRK